MAFQPAPNTVSVEFRGTYLGEQVESMLHFELPGTPTALDVENIATDMNNWWAGTPFSLMSTGYIYRETYARSLHSSAAPEFTVLTNAGDPGGQVSPAMPGNVTFTIKFLTGLTGRSFRGRNYVTGIVENMCIGNAIDVAVADAWKEGYEEIFPLATSGGYVWVVLSRVQGGVVLTNAVGAPVTNVGYSDLFLDSQRRRLAGRGA